MYPERMRWVDIYLMRSDLRRTVDHLHDSRIIQSLETNKHRDRSIDQRFLEQKTRIDKIIEFLAPLEKIDKDFFKRFLDNKTDPLSVGEGSALLEQASGWTISTIEKVDPLRKERTRCEEALVYLRDLRSKLMLLTGLDMDLKTFSSLKRIRTKIGTTRRYGELTDALTPLGADVRSSLLDKKEGLHSVRIIYTPSMAERVEDALRGRIFSEINLDLKRIAGFLDTNGSSSSYMKDGPVKLIAELDVIEDVIEKRISELDEQGSILASETLDEARGFSEALEIEIEKDRMEGSTGSTVYTSRISGWVPKRRMDELARLIKGSTKGSYHIASRPPYGSEIDDNKVPTKLKNGKLGAMFEPLTTTFAVPKYNEIDPSLFISIPFIFFFGLMLGDAGYGLLILLPSICIFIKGKGSSSLRMMSTFGILMGAATTIAGIWMGSIFGDLIPRLVLGDPEAKIYSLSLFGMDLPYDTLRDPMLLFQMSLWLGFLQLNFGFLLLGYDRMKKGDPWGFIKGAFSWMLIEGGAIVFLGGILFGWWELTGPLPAFGGILFLAGSVLLFFEIGGMFLFNIEGLVGDWISYTRILALGLSTFGLAMAFNIVGEMLVDIHIVLVIVVALLLIILHIFNLLLQTLGAAVHSIRLQFVEFFGRFYDGGGELFEPFGIERYYSRNRNFDKGGK